MNEAKTIQKSQPAKATNGKSTGGIAKASKHPKNNDKLLYMKFHLDFIEKLRDQLCTALKLKTHAELPVYFRSPCAFPAAIGLNLELEKRYNIEAGSEEQKILRKTLGQYLGSSQYINAMCAMPKRYTLNMEPAEEVQDSDREFYQVKLKARIKTVIKRRERENSQNDASPKISLPRQGITCLREGAAPNAIGKPVQTKPV